MTKEYIQSAFPVLERGGNGLELTDAGMTLRDYFAGQVIGAVYREFWQGVRNREHASDERWREGIAIDAYWIADAMLAMRSAKVAMTAEPENPHRALLLQIHAELSNTACADADPANWEGHTLHRIEQLLWPEGSK